MNKRISLNIIELMDMCAVGLNVQIAGGLIGLNRFRQIHVIKNSSGSQIYSGRLDEVSAEQIFVRREEREKSKKFKEWRCFDPF